MAPARRKAPSQNAPQTIEEATRVAGDYIALLTEIEKTKADADQSIAAIEAARDGMIKPVEEQMKDLFKQLRAWWAVAKDQMTDGQRKSIELAGAKIGERTTTPSLKLPKGMAATDFARWLIAAKLFHLVRTKRSVDRQACIKTFSANGNNSKLLTKVGASVSQKEEFFIDRAGDKGDDPEEVDISEEGGAA